MSRPLSPYMMYAPDAVVSALEVHGDRSEEYLAACKAHAETCELEAQQAIWVREVGLRHWSSGVVKWVKYDPARPQANNWQGFMVQVFMPLWADKHLMLSDRLYQVSTVKPEAEEATSEDAIAVELAYLLAINGFNAVFTWKWACPLDSYRQYELSAMVHMEQIMQGYNEDLPVPSLNVLLGAMRKVAKEYNAKKGSNGKANCHLVVLDDGTVYHRDTDGDTLLASIGVTRKEGAQ